MKIKKEKKRKYYALTKPEFLEKTSLICPRCGGPGYIESAINIIQVGEIYQQTQPIICPYCSDDGIFPLKIGERIIDGGTREGFFERLFETLEAKSKNHEKEFFKKNKKFQK